MDCFLIAGGMVRVGHPLYELAPEQPKSLIDLAGRPMAQWVVDALTGAAQVERIVVLGLGPEDGLSSPKIAGYVPDQGSMLDNGLAGVTWLRQRRVESPRHVLVCCADIPLLTSAMVEAFVMQCADPTQDVYYSVVSRTVMEQRFPGSGRSYLHFLEGDIAGGDLHIIAPQVAETHADLLAALVHGRKSAFREVRRLGAGFFAKFAARRLSFAEGEQQIAKKWGLRVRIFLNEHAEVAMDVDKPHQLELCQRELEK